MQTGCYCAALHVAGSIRVDDSWLRASIPNVNWNAWHQPWTDGFLSYDRLRCARTACRPFCWSACTWIWKQYVVSIVDRMCFWYAVFTIFTNFQQTFHIVALQLLVVGVRIGHLVDGWTNRNRVGIRSFHPIFVGKSSIYDQGSCVRIWQSTYTALVVSCVATALGYNVGACSAFCVREFAAAQYAPISCGHYAFALFHHWILHY